MPEFPFTAVVASGHGSNKTLLQLRQPCGITGHRIDLEVDIVAFVQCAEGRHAQGMGNDQYRKCIPLDGIDRERDAIERNRSLGRDKVRKLARRAQHEAGHFSQVFAPHDRGDPVHVADNQMSAQFVAEFQRPLEIDLGPLTPTAHRRDTQGLGCGINREPGAATLLAGIHNRQTDARTGDRCALVDVRARVVAGNGNAMQIIGARLDRTHFAYARDDAGKHDSDADERFDRIDVEFLASSEVSRLVSASSGMPSSGSMPPTPTDLTPCNRTASSTRSFSTKLAARIGPPSSISRVIPCSARTLRTCRRSSRSPLSSTRKTLQPFSRRISSAICDGLRDENTQVGVSRTVATTDVESGRINFSSSTTRTGERSNMPGRRQVSWGSSASTVPIPTMMASLRARIWKTRSRAVSLVIATGFRPGKPALPSAEIASFTVT